MAPGVFNTQAPLPEGQHFDISTEAFVFPGTNQVLFVPDEFSESETVSTLYSTCVDITNTYQALALSSSSDDQCSEITQTTAELAGLTPSEASNLPPLVPCENDSGSMSDINDSMSDVSYFSETFVDRPGVGLNVNADSLAWLENKKFEIQSLDFTPTQECAIKFLEPLTVCVYGLFKAASVESRLAHAIQFLQAQAGGSLFLYLCEQDVMSKLHEVLSGWNLLKLQSSPLDKLEEGLDFYAALRDSPIFERVSKCLLYLMSVPIFNKLGFSFDKLGYNVLESRALRRKFAPGTDMAHYLLETLVFVIREGSQIMKTGCWDGILHAGSTYAELFQEIETLKRQAPFYANFDAIGISEHEFVDRLDEAVTKIAGVKKAFKHMSNSERRTVEKAETELILMQNEILSKRAAKRSRKAPFAVLIAGASSIGKSSLTRMLFFYTASVLGLPTGDTHFFSKNALANFWDGFTSAVWCILLDDVASEKRGLLTTISDSLKEILQIINYIPFLPDMAALEDKGKTPMRPRLVIATTNTPSLNLDAQFSAPEAVMRRFALIVIPTVKSEFAGPTGNLDSSTISDLEKYPDYWTFDVYRSTTERDNNGKPVLRLVGKNLSTAEYLKLYRAELLKHEAGQEAALKGENVMRNSCNCDLCHLPTKLCSCKVQSLDTVAWFSLWVLLMLSLSHHLMSLVIRYWCVRRVYITVCRAKHYLRSLWPSQTAEYWRNMGDRVRWNYGYTMIGAAFLSGLGVVLTLSHMRKFVGNLQTRTISRTDDDEETSVESSSSLKVERSTTARKPTPDAKLKPNVWKTSEFNTNKIEVSARSRCATLDDAFDQISKNCVFVSIEREDGNVRESRWTCLGGQMWLTNNHSVPEGDNMVTIISEPRSDGVNANRTILVTESQLKRYPDKDLVFIELLQFPPRRKLTNLFALKEFDVRSDGMYLSRNEDGSLIRIPVSRCQYVGQTTIPDFTTLDTWAGLVSIPTQNGFCGTPLVLKSPNGPVIVGIHSLGHGNEVRATRVTSDFILKALSKEDSFAVQSGFPKLSAPGFERPLTNLHHKSTFRYIESGSAEVHGSFVGFRPKPRSRVEPTPAAPLLREAGFEETHCAPDMVSYKPWKIAADHLTKPVSTIRHDILEEVADAMFDDIVEELPEGRLQEVHVLDDHTAINGAPSVRFLDALKKSTSMGNPFKKAKKYFMVPDPTEELPEAVAFTPEIRERIDAIEATYISGETTKPNFCAHLKDEPVKHSKAELGKTRVFCGAPADWSVIVRKYLLSFVKLVQENKYVFESAPGTIAQSMEWDEIYRYLVYFGVNMIIAGDYAAFDKTMAAMMMIIAFRIIVKLLRKAGYTDDDIRVILGISLDTSFPLTDFNGDLVTLLGSNPSGHPLTVILNGLCNSLYMRYVFRILNPAKEVRTFKKYVHLMTYGDDNIMGVSPQVPWFNHTNIQKELARIGVKYTMADKEAESVPFINIADASFLKRTWRFEPELGAMVCPLEEASIQKSLMTWVRSKTVCPQDQMVSVVSSAVREYFWYGKEIFEQKRDFLMELIAKLGYDDYVCPTTFPTWDDLCTSWRQMSAEL